MSTATQKPTILTRSGHSLTVAPGTEKPISADEWLGKIREWRERNRELVSKISVEEFLTEKRADAERGSP